jgi:hypothetical protein
MSPQRVALKSAKLEEKPVVDLMDVPILKTLATLQDFNVDKDVQPFMANLLDDYRKVEEQWEARPEKHGYTSGNSNDALVSSGQIIVDPSMSPHFRGETILPPRFDTRLPVHIPHDGRHWGVDTRTPGRMSMLPGPPQTMKNLSQKLGPKPRGADARTRIRLNPDPGPPRRGWVFTPGLGVVRRRLGDFGGLDADTFAHELTHALVEGRLDTDQVFRPIVPSVYSGPSYPFLSSLREAWRGDADELSEVKEMLTAVSRADARQFLDDQFKSNQTSLRSNPTREFLSQFADGDMQIPFQFFDSEISKEILAEIGAIRRVLKLNPPNPFREAR